MPWPTPQDYNEAIQNPKQCFADPELRAGSAELNTLGLPRPITGNFASVYRVHCGKRDWAVRCFWREFADLQTRYSAISAHLAAVHLAYTVGFEYLTQGINVRGAWYPVLKMEWVEGELLDSFVRNHLGESKKLRELVTDWRQMCVALERAGVAHGDLQHGNVLVSNGRLVLVDYDGMYVPALSGRGSHETGHPHYQHPKRSGVHFGDYLDRFSEWSISASLLAVAAEPDLWTQLNGGDECLVLRKTDYDDPSSSAAFQILTQHSDAGVREAANHLRSFLNVDLTKVRPLDDSSKRTHSGGTVPRGRFRLAASSMVSSIVPNVPVEALAFVPPKRSAGPHWLADHVEMDRPVVELSARYQALTFLLVAVALMIGVSTVTVFAFATPILVAGLVDAGGLIIGFVSLIVSYRRIEIVRQAGDAIARVRKLQREESALRRMLAAAERERNLVTRYLGQSLADLQLRRDELRNEETEKREALQAAYEQRSQSLSKRLSEYGQEQDTTVKAAVKAEQALHVQEHLRHATLWSAPVPGVGWATKIRLLALGVWSAADVSAEKIRIIQGLGERQLLPLVTWRVEAEKLVRRTAPKQLPQETRSQLVARQARTLKRFEVENRASKDELSAREEQLATWSTHHASELDLDEQSLREEQEERVRSIQSDVARLQSRLTELNLALSKEYASLQPYRNVQFGLYLRSLLGARRVAGGRTPSDDVIQPGP
jgi:hypothetical protein